MEKVLRTNNLSAVDTATADDSDQLARKSDLGTCMILRRLTTWFRPLPRLVASTPRHTTLYQFNTQHIRTIMSTPAAEGLHKDPVTGEMISKR